MVAEDGVTPVGRPRLPVEDGAVDGEEVRREGGPPTPVGLRRVSRQVLSTRSPDPVPPGAPGPVPVVRVAEGWRTGGGCRGEGHDLLHLPDGRGPSVRRLLNVVL